MAWFVILIGIVLWVWKPGMGPGDEMDTEEQGVPSGQLIGAEDTIAGRLALGLAGLMDSLNQPDDDAAMQQVAVLNTGSLPQRVAHAILAGGIEGVEQARKEIDALREEPSDDPATAAILLPEIERVLDAVQDGRRPPATAVDELETRLGWYGRLAGSLGDPAALDAMKTQAVRTVAILFVALGVAGLVGLLGFVGLVVLLVFALTGRIRDRIRPTAHHGVYAETFAIWLPSLLLLQFLVALVAPPTLVVLASAGAFFASLLVLVWPVVRGVPWRTVRADIGLPAARFRDVPLGIAGYAMSLPLLAVGLVVTLLLILLATLLSGESPSPSHPAQQALIGGGGWQAMQIFVLATIAAPIVEEIMFRGVLFSHLRGAMRGWHASVGIVLAALVSSVIFAAIHPQGLVFIPALAGLGIGFCLCREWTGSLVPAMVAHAVNNGLVLSLSLFLFAS